MNSCCPCREDQSYLTFVASSLPNILILSASVSKCSLYAYEIFPYFCILLFSLCKHSCSRLSSAVVQSYKEYLTISRRFGMMDCTFHITVDEI